MRKSKSGFTIVELLIVVVIIAILAAITIAAYNGIQQRARDIQRKQDVATIKKALEMYYTDNGSCPTSSCDASCPTPKKINAAWSTTSDGAWSVLAAQLVPKYISKMPVDPQASTDTNAAIYGGYNYDYVLPGWCGKATAQIYALTYKLEGEAQKNEVVGNCPAATTQPFDYPGSSE